MKGKMTPGKTNRKLLPNITEDEIQDGSSAVNSHVEVNQMNVDSKSELEHFESADQNQGLFSRRHSDKVLADVNINHHRRLLRVESERIERDLNVAKEKRAASDPQHVATQIEIYNRQSNIPFQIHLHEKVIFFLLRVQKYGVMCQTLCNVTHLISFYTVCQGIQGFMILLS